MAGDVSLLFDVAGGGTLSGDSGAEIQKQLNSIVSEINKSPFKIKFQADEDSLNKMREAVQKITESFKEIKAGDISSQLPGFSFISDLRNELSLLAKSLSEFKGINFDVNLGNNSFSTMNKYSSSAIAGIKELKAQASELESVFLSMTNASSGMEAVLKVATKSKALTGDTFDLFEKIGDNKASLREQLDTYKEYISLMERLAKINGIDISNITSGFSRNADQIIQSTERIQSGEQELETGLNKLKSVFGSSIDATEINTRLDSINSSIQDVIRTLEKLIQDGSNIDVVIEKVNTAISTIDKLGTANNTARSISEGVEKITQSAGNTASSVGNIVASLDESKVSSIVDTLKTIDGIDDKGAVALAKSISEVGVTSGKVKAKVEELKDGVQSLISLSVNGKNANGDTLSYIFTYDKKTQEVKKTLLEVGAAWGEVEQKSSGASKKTSGISEEAKAAKKSFDDATDAINKFYDLQIKVAKLGTDIEYNKDGKVYTSKSGTWTEYARQLTDARRLCSELTSEERQANFTEQQRAEIISLLTDRVNELNRALEEQRNKASTKTKTHADDTKTAYADATRAVKEYYATLTQLGNAKSDVTLTSEGWKSESGRWDELAAALNRTKTAFDLYTNAENQSKMSGEERINFLRLLTTESEKYAIAAESQSNKEIAAAEKAAKARRAEASEMSADEIQINLLKIDKLRESVNTTIQNAGKFGVDSDNLARLKELSAELDALRANTANGSVTNQDFANSFTKIGLAADIAGASIKDETNTIKTILKPETAAFGVAQQELSRKMSRAKDALTGFTAAKNSNNLSSRNAYTAIQNEYKSYEQLTSELHNGKMYEEDFAAAVKHSSGVVAENIRIIKENGDAHKTTGEKIQGAIAKFSQWFSVTRIAMAAYRMMKQMVSAVIEVDTAMTELRKVTDETESAYNRFLENATKRTKALGATLTDTINATAEFARLGYTLEESSQLADAAIVYKNVGDGIEDIGEASESVISTMKAFGVEASDAMLIVDKFNEVGNNFAISSKGVGDALVRSASAMHAANNTLDETIALITTANTVVQNPYSVGTTMKTLSMYLRAAKTEAEEAGESTEGMADSVSKLRGEILALTGGKVDIQIDEDSFKSTYQIIKELSEVWGELTDISQANILEKIGGKRNSNVVSALIENFQLAEDVMKSSANAAGSATAENEKYLESIQGHIDVLKASFETFSTDLLNSDLIKFIVDAGTGVINLLDSATRLHLLLPAILAAITLIKGTGMAKMAMESASKVATLSASLIAEKTATDSLAASVSALSVKQKQQVATNILNAVASGKLTEAEGAQMLAALGLAAADGTLTVANKGLATSFKSLMASIPVFGWIALAISLVIEAVTVLTRFIDTTSDSIAELDTELDSLTNTAKTAANEFTNLKSNADEIIPRFAELAKGVDEFGNRLTDANGKMILTDEEYEEFWELNNKIAEMFPDLDVGIDSNGNHILSLSYSVDTLTESLEALVEAERQATNQKIIEGLDDTLDNIKSADEQYSEEKEALQTRVDAYKEASDEISRMYREQDKYKEAYGDGWEKQYQFDTSWYVTQMQQAFGPLSDPSVVDAWQKMVSKYEIPGGDYGEIDWRAVINSDEFKNQMAAVNREMDSIEKKQSARWRKINSMMGAWLQTTDLYAIATDEIKNLLPKVIGNINYGDIGITDGDELKEYLQDNVIDTLMDASPDVQDAVKRLFLNDGELSINEFESLANKIKEQFGDDNPVYLYVKSNLDDVAEEAGVVRSFVKDQTDTAELQKELDALEQREKALIRLNELAEEYNSLTIGNVDYGKRPFITPEKMVASGWEDFEGDIATTFTQGVTIGGGEYLYTIDVTPILEDGTVLSPEALHEYIRTLVTDNGIESILESDKYNLVVNAVVGDYDPSYWEPYEEKLSEIKDEHYQLADSMGLVTEKFATDSKVELNNVSKDIARIKDEFDANVDNMSIGDLKTARTLLEGLKIPDGVLLSWEELTRLMEESKNQSKKIDPPSFASVLSDITSLSAGLDKLDKIYADMLDGKDFDFSSLVSEDFVKEFGNIGETYEQFIEKIANSPNDIEACQDAFNRLSAEYIANKGYLDNVTDSTRNMTVSVLEQMGIANAAAIVDAKLAYEKEKLVYTTGEYTEKTYEELSALYEEAETGTTAKQILAELALEKALTNENEIKTSDDIERLENLATAANATRESLNNLAEAKLLTMKAEEWEKNSALPEYDRRMISQGYYRQAQEVLNRQLSYEKPSINYSGGSSSRSAKESAAKESEDKSKTSSKEETWFEKQYKLHKHLLEMEQESEEEYLTWLDSAYKKADEEGILSTDDLYRYQEEVFKGFNNLAGKQIDEYVADIDDYYEATKKLESAEHIREEIETNIKYADRTEDKIKLTRELISAYGDEYNATENIVALRTKTIESNIQKLEELGFQIQFNSDANELYISNTEHLNELQADSVGEYKSLQEATNALRKDTENLIDTVEELNEKNRDDIKSIRELQQSVSEAKKDIISYLNDIVKAANDMVDGFQKVYSTLTEAAKEYSDNGYLSVDSLQKILELSPKYLSMLANENGQLVINEQTLRTVIAAKTDELGAETALAYAKQILLATERGEIQTLISLADSSAAASGATWDMAYATVGLARAIGTANGTDAAYYDNAVSYISKMQSLTKTAVDSVSAYFDTINDSTKESLKNQQGGLDTILKMTEDLIKHENKDVVDALKDQKDAYSDIIEQKKKLIKLTKEEDDHNSSINDKLKKAAKLQAQIAALSLDDSRSAQAEKRALEEELAELQGEITDEQADYYVDAQIDALDSELDAFNDTKDAEIDELSNSLSSTEKLYQAAISRISNNWDTLYNDLLAWNYEYGTTLQSDLTSAWDSASKAVQRYGSYLAAVSGVAAEIDASNSGLSPNGYTLSEYTDYGSGTYGSAANIITAMRNNSLNWWGATNSERESLDANNLALAEQYRQLSGENIYRNNGTWYHADDSVLYTVDKDEIARNIVSKMENNSALWSSANDESTRKILESENERLAKNLSSLLGASVTKDSGGTWWVDGKKLYSIKYHSGGIVGDNPTLKQNEVMAILEKGEAVLDEEREKGLYKIIDFVSVLSEKLGTVLDESNISRIFNSAPSIDIPNALASGVKSSIGDIAGSINGNGNYTIERIDVTAPISVVQKLDSDDIKEHAKMIGAISADYIKNGFTKRGISTKTSIF